MQAVLRVPADHPDVGALLEEAFTSIMNIYGTDEPYDVSCSCNALLRGETKKFDTARKKKKWGMSKPSKRETFFSLTTKYKSSPNRKIKNPRRKKKFYYAYRDDKEAMERLVRPRLQRF